jgi:SEC-C motif-containing protein
MNRYADCPCHSKSNYQKCCRTYHLGTPAPNATALMRSRYSAYSLNLPDYLMATTHPKNEQYMEDASAWKQSIQQFTKNTLFKSLEILDASEDGANATVTFRAGLMQGLKDISFTEKSSFEKIDGRWLYLDGVKDED